MLNHNAHKMKFTYGSPRTELDEVFHLTTLAKANYEVCSDKDRVLLVENGYKIAVKYINALKERKIKEIDATPDYGIKVNISSFNEKVSQEVADDITSEVHLFMGCGGGRVKLKVIQFNGVNGDIEMLLLNATSEFDSSNILAENLKSLFNSERRDGVNISIDKIYILANETHESYDIIADRAKEYSMDSFESATNIFFSEVAKYWFSPNMSYKDIKKVDVELIDVFAELFISIISNRGKPFTPNFVLVG